MANNNYTLFKGKEAILKAYMFNKVPAWAIFVDRVPMFSYNDDDLEVGEDFLAQAINDLIECMGNGVFQLRVYRDVPAKGILNNTPFNYGFKFALQTDDQYEEKPGSKTIAGLQKQIDELRGGGEEEEEVDDSFMGKVGAFLKQRPEIEDFLMKKVMGWVNNHFGQQNPMPANMAGFTNMDTTQQAGQQPRTSADLYNALPTEEKQNFDQAAYILMANDPQVGTHLMKLANLLINNPAMYQTLTKM
jgi:hypothetical protein